MSFSLQGLASGMDTSEIIKALMDVERVPLTTLKSKKSTLEQQQAVFRQLNTKLVSFNLAASEMRYESTFNKNAASTSKNGVLTASTTEAALKGSYEIEVTKLAQNEVTGLKDIKFSGADGVDQFKNATFNIDGKSINIASLGTDANPIDSNEKALKALVAKINSNTQEYGGKASLINADGKGNYTFSMTSLDASKPVGFELTGVTNTVPSAVEDNPDTPEDESLPVTSIKTLTSGTPLQAAQHAELKINGIAVTRSSNEIKDLIAGVTLNLTSVDKTTLNINRDNDAIIKTTEKFVNAYNDVIDLINTNLAKPSDENTANPLQSDSLLRTIKDSLYAAFNEVIPASVIKDGTGRAGVLEQIGLSIDKNVTSTSQRTGKITFDQEAFKSALSDNPDRVMNMFINRAESIYETVRTGFSGTKGMIASRVSGYDSQIKMVDDRLEVMERSLQLKEERLKMQFNNMEVMMSSMNSTSNWLTSQFNSLYSTQ